MTEGSKGLIALGADHNGVELKATLIPLLADLGYECVDMGPVSTDEKVDYPDYARKVAEAVEQGEARFGILICGTGMGMSITANRYPHVRAALVHSVEVAKKCREHNDANVLCLGAWVNTTETNIEIVRAWLAEPFGEGRHIPRVEKTKFVPNA